MYLDDLQLDRRQRHLAVLHLGLRGRRRLELLLDQPRLVERDLLLGHAAVPVRRQRVGDVGGRTAKSTIRCNMMDG